MGAYYCKSCKLLYRENVPCGCGRRLNTTSEAMIETYLEKGYQFVKTETVPKQDRAKEIETIKKDIQAKLGFPSSAEMFDPKNIIAGYEEQRKQEEKQLEEERKRKQEEILLKKKRAQEEKEAERRRMLGLEPETKNEEPKEIVSKETVPKKTVPKEVQKTAAFLAGLGLEKK